MNLDNAAVEAFSRLPCPRPPKTQILAQVEAAIVAKEEKDTVAVRVDLIWLVLHAVVKALVKTKKM